MLFPNLKNMKEPSLKEIKRAIEEGLKQYDKLLQLTSDETVKYKDKTLSVNDALEKIDNELDELMQKFAIAKDKEDNPLKDFL